MLHVGERRKDLDCAVLVLDHVSCARADRLTLQARWLLTLFAAFLLDGIVLANARQELFAALGWADVLSTKMHALLHLTVADDLVDLDADGVWGNVENDTGAAMVV